MHEDALLSGWASIVDRIIRGEDLRRPAIVVGRTPLLLQQFGLHGSSMTMTVAKVARCRRDHPEVPLAVWHQLPDLLSDPLAIFPSRRRDGSIIILLVVLDWNDDPVLLLPYPAKAVRTRSCPFTGSAPDFLGSPQKWRQRVKRGSRSMKGVTSLPLCRSCQ